MHLVVICTKKKSPIQENHAQILHQIKIIVEFRLGRRLTQASDYIKILEYRT